MVVRDRYSFSFIDKLAAFSELNEVSDFELFN